MLKRRETRHHWNDSIAESLRQTTGRPKGLRHDVGHFDDALDYREPLCTVAVEQWLTSVPTQHKIEFPGQIPNILQTGVHSLTAKWAVNVRGISADEEAADAQLCHMAMVDAKITAPTQRMGFNPIR